MTKTRIDEQYAGLVRRALVANEDPRLGEVGKLGKIRYLVEDNVDQNQLGILDVLIESQRSRNAPHAADAMQRHRDAIEPYVGKQLLRAGMRGPGRQFEFLIDPVAEILVHVSEMPDAQENELWLNMNLEWFDTIEDEPSYRDWLDSVLFREDFFEAAVFEESHPLYRVQLHDTLLEDVIYRGIEPARFQKADLNAAIQVASTSVHGHCEAKWFHVNVHDNLSRVVEKYGRYSFDWPLVPIYILLQYHQAKEGGTTYAGLASAQREWVLLFENSLSISVHGQKRFVDCVRESLERRK